MLGGRGRGGGGGGRGGGPPNLADGDWKCPNPGCTNVNFARRTECNRCHTARPDGAAGASGAASAPASVPVDARGPPGLFKAGDWACTVCGNMNWERRFECNICKGPKPGIVGADEKRDGAGGGFNERQERVASAKKEVDEDGYDDFGIKKKTVRATKAEREAAALARLKQSYSAVIISGDVPSLPTLHPLPPTSSTTARPGHDSKDKNLTTRRSRSPVARRSEHADLSHNRRPRSRSRERPRERGRDRRSPRHDRDRDPPRQRERSRSQSRDRDRGRDRDRDAHDRHHHSRRR